jgi:hypothetical protein
MQQRLIAGYLSSRTPLNDGCRNSPSWVQPRYSISLTSSGRTRIVPGSGTPGTAVSQADWRPPLRRDLRGQQHGDKPSGVGAFGVWICSCRLVPAYPPTSPGASLSAEVLRHFVRCRLQLRRPRAAEHERQARTDATSAGRRTRRRDRRDTRHKWRARCALVAAAPVVIYFAERGPSPLLTKTVVALICTGATSRSQNKYLKTLTAGRFSEPVIAVNNQCNTNVASVCSRNSTEPGHKGLRRPGSARPCPKLLFLAQSHEMPQMSVGQA